jgi:ribose transport system permease protein
MSAGPATEQREDIALSPEAGILASAWAATRLFRPAAVLLVALLVSLTLAESAFFTELNLQSIGTSVSILWLVALGATFVQLSGGIDLSSGATAALSGICLGKLLGTGLPGWVVIAVVLLFGAAAGGAVNGLLIGVFRLNVFVVTLASMTAFTGAVTLWSGSSSQYVTAPAVSWLALSKVLSVPVPLWVMLITLGAFLFLQSRTHFGRDIYAIGGSATAARLSGIRAPRTVIAVYGIAGAMAALAGVISVGLIGATSPQPDNTLPLNAIAAILIGGTALSGGVGGVAGTALGVLLLGVLQNGLSLSGASSAWQQVVTGAVLVIAVLADRFPVIRARFGGWRTSPRGPGRAEAATRPRSPNGHK